MPILSPAATIANRRNCTIDPAALEEALRRREVPLANSAEYWSVMGGAHPANLPVRRPAASSSGCPPEAKQSKLALEDEEIGSRNGSGESSSDSAEYSTPNAGDE